MKEKRKKDMELIIEYMKEQNAKSNENGFERYLKEKTEEAYERGYKKGIKEWKKEGVYEIIKKMQQENISLDLIKRITGLSEKEITKIINSKIQ